MSAPSCLKTPTASAHGRAQMEEYLRDLGSSQDPEFDGIAFLLRNGWAERRVHTLKQRYHLANRFLVGVDR